MNKMIQWKMCLVMVLCLCLTACGGPSTEEINVVKAKCEEIQEVYNRIAPTVAKLDDASVEIYAEAGKTVRKAIKGIEVLFDKYDKADLQALSVEIDTAMLSLKSLENKQPPAEIKKPSNDYKTYAFEVYNHTGDTFRSLFMRSGSGLCDVSVALGTPLAPEVTATVTASVPDSEIYTVSATDTEGKEVSFSGKFYISSADKLTLTAQNGAYLIQVDHAKAEEPEQPDKQASEEQAE